MSKIFVIVNPWAIQDCEEILLDIDIHGTQLKRARVTAVPEEIIREHYAHKVGMPYFEPMIRGLVGQSVELAVYRGDTDRFNELKPVIRGKYNPRFSPAPDFKKEAVHFSDSEEAAVREMRLWGSFLEL